MTIEFKKSFKKTFDKLPVLIQNKFESRLLLFIDNNFHPLLNNHSVHPSFEYGRSINITGDYRAIFLEKDDRIIFIKIGTHSELYD